MLSDTRTSARRDALEAAAAKRDRVQTLSWSAEPISSSSSSPRMRPWRRRLLFVLNFLRHPIEVGTLFQSSGALVRRLAGGVEWTRVRHAVELGPGVGTVTQALLAHMAPGARLLAIEANADFVVELERELDDPRLIAVHGDATRLTSHLATHGMPRVDLIVSGIPFSTLPKQVRAAVLDAATAALRDDGELLIYQHSALLAPLLRERYDEVRTEIEWRSAVPMRVFRCRGPRRDTGSSEAN